MKKNVIRYVLQINIMILKTKYVQINALKIDIMKMVLRNVKSQNIVPQNLQILILENVLQNVIHNITVK